MMKTEQYDRLTEKLDRVVFEVESVPYLLLLKCKKNKRKRIKKYLQI